jgi:hypothetical protein
MSNTTSPGAHDGYAGASGTYVLLDGLRIAVDPATLKQIPASTGDKTRSKPKSKSEPGTKTGPALNKTE